MRKLGDSYQAGRRIRYEIPREQHSEQRAQKKQKKSSNQPPLRKDSAGVNKRTSKPRKPYGRKQAKKPLPGAESSSDIALTDGNNSDDKVHDTCVSCMAKAGNENDPDSDPTDL